MIDFELRISGQTTIMTFSKTDSLANNIWLSLHIAKGSFFAQPAFGSQLHEIKKITDANLLLARSYCLDALSWLRRIGRIKNTEATVSRDSEVPNRIKIHVVVTKNDGNVADYSIFYSVV